MGCCCCTIQKDESLQGLQHDLHIHAHGDLFDQTTSHNGSALVVDHVQNATDNAIENVDRDEEDTDDDDIKVMTETETESYLRILNKMHRRKNLKSYLTEIKKSKQQCITKKKKLKQLLLDQNNEIEYSTAFDLNKSPNAPKFKQLSSSTVFPEISFTEFVRDKTCALNRIINSIYSASIGYVPDEIAMICCCYTLDLLPGIYEFAGRMDYNGVDDEYDQHSEYFGPGNHCACQIVLNSRSEVVGGYFGENAFKYYITNGSYTYDIPCRIEFSKEYYDLSYSKYKVYGQIIRNMDERICFQGHWKMLDGSRGGHVNMEYIANRAHNDRLSAAKYEFCGYCKYLPNVNKEYLIQNTQYMKCTLNLRQDCFRMDGFIEFKTIKSAMSVQSSDEYDGDEETGARWMIDEVLSEWDIYGGLQIQFKNGYAMNGFFNGKDFMGVCKDAEFVRFGHFQCELSIASPMFDSDQTCIDQTIDGHSLID